MPRRLQEQTETGAGPETDCFGQRETGVSTSAVPAMAPLSVGGEQASEVQQEGGQALAVDGRCLVEVTPPVERARRTSPQTGGPTLATGGLQQQGLNGVQQGEGLPSATATMRLAMTPPQVETRTGEEYPGMDECGEETSPYIGRPSTAGVAKASAEEG